MADFFFYDLETSGLDCRQDRIMQFAGQRTDQSLQTVGDPVNLLVKLSPDVLPDPSAIMLTGITPQKTIEEGLTEAEFLDYFSHHVALPGTIFTGYNSVRFDDEFMRCLHYRNFYDPYEWHWKEDRSRWDLLDVVRMTRALRQEGIQWPVTEEGKPLNRLESLTAANGLDHQQAHDALSDVMATIAVAQLIRDRQPKLFSWLLGNRHKSAVKKIVESGQPFIYTSGKYPSEFEHTTATIFICPHPSQQGALVYDCRQNPAEYLDLTPAELAERWQRPGAERLPVKVVQYNRCPAVAPLAVLDAASQQRLKLPLATIHEHAQLIKSSTQFCNNLEAALRLLDEARQQASRPSQSVDDRIYDGFYPDTDKPLLAAVRQSQPDDIDNQRFKFSDSRLNQLLPLYKARNFPASLTPEERLGWEKHCAERLYQGGPDSRLAKYFESLQQIAVEANPDKQYLLEELQLYGQSIMPSDVTA